MKNPLVSRIRQTAVGFAVAIGAVGAAHAGAVSLKFDPFFGGTFTNLEYSGIFNFTVADSCINTAPSTGTVQINTVTACGGAIAGTGTLTLFNGPEAAPTSTQSVNVSLNISELFLTDGFVTGWNTNESTFFTDFRTLPNAQSKDYTLQYADIPIVTAYTPCALPGTSCETLAGSSSQGDLGGTVLYATDNGQSPLGHDINGDNIGLNYTYNSAGTSRTFSPTANRVPEPASLALVATALLACGLVRRRKT